MYDTFDEILDYFNLFLWNSRRQAPNQSIKKADIFTADGDFISTEAETKFRQLCENYISFVRGENPFTFPFRLPPPDSMIAKNDRTHDAIGKKITFPRKYLTLVGDVMSEFQENIVKDLRPRAMEESRVISVYPEDLSFSETFKKEDGKYSYNGDTFLAPSQIATYSAKFASIMKCIEGSRGIVFVYSNLVESGARLFAMCLEEHGFSPASGESLLAETSGEVGKGTKGRYTLFTSETSDSEIKRNLARLRRRENVNGDEIRIIVSSPKVAEGVDFRYVRQIHVLDPWFNMSRIEQVVGRGLRTCSHSLLPFEEQNCTVYLHVCRFSSGKREAVDETIYRDYAERKAIAIAKVKKVIMQSAMDCTLEIPVNTLPSDWMDLTITQTRSQDSTPVSLPLSKLTSSSFLEDSSFECKVSESPQDPTHVRPLSAILDVKDELLDKVIQLFQRKPIWKQEDLYAVLKKYDTTLVKYILQNAISMGFKLKDINGRIGRLEAKKGIFSFAMGEHDTMVERLVPRAEGTNVPLNLPIIEEEAAPRVVEAKSVFAEKVASFEWPAFAKDFSPAVLEWYYVDHALSPKDKITRILDVLIDDPDNAPLYAKPLYIYNDSDDSYFYVLGSEQFYNADYDEFTPIAEQKDAYTEWVERLKTKFIAQKDDYVVTLKDGAIIFNIDEKNLPLQRVKRSKNIGGRACTSYKIEFLNAFAEWLGTPFPSSVNQKPQRCMYLDLLVRKAILENKSGLTWFTPEEWSVISEKQNSDSLRNKLK